MNTSQFSKYDLPEDLQYLFDDKDVISIDPLFDSDMSPIGIDQETYDEGRMASAKKLVAHRKFTQEMLLIYKKHEEGRISDQEAQRLSFSARQRYLENG